LHATKSALAASKIKIAAALTRLAALISGSSGPTGAGTPNRDGAKVARPSRANRPRPGNRRLTDPEGYRTYQRDLMRKRRAAAREAKAGNLVAEPVLSVTFP
jgi:hypothetical protein